MKSWPIWAVLAACLFASPALAQSTPCEYSSSTQTFSPGAVRVQCDSNGNLKTTGTLSQGAGGGSAWLVIQSGSLGQGDSSANAATVPISGFTLLATIATNPVRNSVEVQNQSAAQIQVVKDDGAGGNLTSILLAAGSGANTQGGSWSSISHKGRIRVYGASGAQVAAYQD